MKHRAQTIRFLTEVLVRRLSWTLPAVHESMAQILASELRARFNLGTVSQPMQVMDTKRTLLQGIVPMVSLTSRASSPNRLVPVTVNPVVVGTVFTAASHRTP